MSVAEEKESWEENYEAEVKDQSQIELIYTVFIVLLLRFYWKKTSLEIKTFALIFSMEISQQKATKLKNFAAFFYQKWSLWISPLGRYPKLFAILHCFFHTLRTLIKKKIFSEMFIYPV